MSDKFLSLTPDLYDYLQSVSLHEAAILQKLRQHNQTMSMGHMQISPIQGQFLSFLIHLTAAKKVLEIGVFTGYSTLTMALALAPEGRIIACDMNEEWTSIAKRFWLEAKVEHKIDLRLQPALQSLEELVQQGEENSFDFIFIDADKLNYINYYELAFKLVKPGGLIAIDNVLWSGKVADPTVQDERTAVIRQLNQHLHQDQRIHLSVIPIADGLSLVRKKENVG